METFSVSPAHCEGNPSVTSILPLTKGHWRGALMFSLIHAWTNGWIISGDADDLKRHEAHGNVTVMLIYENDVAVRFNRIYFFAGESAKEVKTMATPWNGDVSQQFVKQTGEFSVILDNMTLMWSHCDRGEKFHRVTCNYNICIFVFSQLGELILQCYIRYMNQFIKNVFIWKLQTCKYWPMIFCYFPSY